MKILWFAAVAAAVVAALLLVSVCHVYAEPYSGARPGFTYDQKAQQYVKVYVAETVLVPVPVGQTLLVNVAPQELPPPVTYSQRAIDQFQQRASADADRLAAIEKALARMERAFSGPPGQDDDLPPVPKTRAANERGKEPQSADPAYLSGRAAGILKTHCAQCHTGSRSRGGFQVFDDAGNFNLPADERDTIWLAVKNDRMPKGPSKLTAAEKSLVRAWSDLPQ